MNRTINYGRGRTLTYSVLCTGRGVLRGRPDAVKKMKTNAERACTLRREYIARGHKWASWTESNEYDHCVRQLRDIRSNRSSCIEYKHSIVLTRAGGIRVVATDYFETATLTSEQRKGLLRQARASLRQQRLRYQNYFQNRQANGCKIDGVRYVNGWFLAESKRRKIRLATEPKHPSTFDRYVGIEIECFVQRKSDETLAEAFYEAGLAPYVCVGDDGSLSCDWDGFASVEVRVLARETEYPEIVRRVCEVLAKHEARVNKSCGLHVHLDCRKIVGRNPKKVHARLVTALPLLSAIVPQSRINNRYCRPNEKKKIIAKTHEDRYRAINGRAYKSHRTIEVRLHSGTVEAAKIHHWIDLVRKIADGPDFGKCPKRLTTLARRLGLSAELCAYIEQRIIKFQSPSPETDYPLPFIHRKRFEALFGATTPVIQEREQESDSTDAPTHPDSIVWTTVTRDPAALSA